MLLTSKEKQLYQDISHWTFCSLPHGVSSPVLWAVVRLMWEGAELGIMDVEGPVSPCFVWLSAGAATLSSSGGPRPTFPRPLTWDLLTPLCSPGTRPSHALSISSLQATLSFSGKLQVVVHYPKLFTYILFLFQITPNDIVYYSEPN